MVKDDITMQTEKEESYQTIFKKYYPPMYYYARRIVGEDAADDVVQEGFLELWNRMDILDTDSPQIESYLYKTIYKKTSDKTFPLEHKLSSLLLKRDIISLIKLCLLCRDNREYIYPDKKQTKGISGAIRGFFFPFIFAYHNSDFYVRE